MGLVVLLAAAVPVQAKAQAGALSELNLPYLHYFGFGAFRVGEAKVWALRARATPSILDYKPRRVGLALRLSGSLIGIQTGDLIPEVGSIGVATAAMGVEARVNVSPRSLLRVYGDVGVAFDTKSDTTAAIGSIGALWEFVFPWKEWEFGMQPTADFVWSTTTAERFNDRLIGLQLKVDARHYLGFHILGNRAQLGGYVDVGHFNGDTDLGSPGTRSDFGDNQIELGVIFGTHPRPVFWFLKPLLSVGLRWGSNFRGIRIGLGDRLTRLPPVP